MYKHWWYKAQSIRCSLKSEKLMQLALEPLKDCYVRHVFLFPYEAHSNPNAHLIQSLQHPKGCAGIYLSRWVNPRSFHMVLQPWTGLSTMSKLRNTSFQRSPC